MICESNSIYDLLMSIKCLGSLDKLVYFKRNKWYKNKIYVWFYYRPHLYN